MLVQIVPGAPWGTREFRGALRSPHDAPVEAAGALQISAGSPSCPLEPAGALQGSAGLSPTLRGRFGHSSSTVF
eukprot:4597133-Alexandrium_andersonii.AAC.1